MDKEPSEKREYTQEEVLRYIIFAKQFKPVLTQVNYSFYLVS